MVVIVVLVDYISSDFLIFCISSIMSAFESFYVHF